MLDAKNEDRPVSLKEMTEKQANVISKQDWLYQRKNFYISLAVLFVVGLVSSLLLVLDNTTDISTLAELEEALSCTVSSMSSEMERIVSSCDESTLRVEVTTGIPYNVTVLHFDDACGQVGTTAKAYIDMKYYIPSLLNRGFVLLFVLVYPVYAGYFFQWVYLAYSNPDPKKASATDTLGAFCCCKLPRLPLFKPYWVYRADNEQHQRDRASARRHLWFFIMLDHVYPLVCYGVLIYYTSLSGSNGLCYIAVRELQQNDKRAFVELLTILTSVSFAFVCVGGSWLLYNVFCKQQRAARFNEEVLNDFVRTEFYEWTAPTKPDTDVLNGPLMEDAQMA